MEDRSKPQPSRRDILAGAGALVAGLGAAAAAREAVGAEPGTDGVKAFQLKELTQVAFVVKDIEASGKKFARLLGTKPPKAIVTDPVEKAHTLYRGKPTPARAKLAFFKLGAVSFELIEPVGGPSTWREVLDKDGEGIHHVAFRVEDMGEARAALDKKGFKTIQTGDFTGGSYAYVDSTSAIGTFIELLQFNG